jgi:hypothetical protein
MASTISRGAWESFSLDAISIPKNVRIMCKSSTTTCASTWRMPIGTLSKDSYCKEKNITKDNQPNMNGSNLTKITERLGKSKFIAPIIRDTLPLRKPQRNYLISSLVRRRTSGC